MIELHGCKGCGSSAVEALLEMAGIEYRREIFEWDDRAGWDRLRTLNPMAQVPTLVLDDDTIVTESAAIALWIAGSHPALLPTGPGERALAYRWIVSFATNIYVPVIVGDFPERWVDGEAAAANLKAKALGRLKDAWAAFESAVTPAPYLLGDRIGAVDVYVAMIARWRPGRKWIAEHCPKAAAAIVLAESHPVVASVWARNFAPA